MPDLSHYLIFHPERFRQRINVSAEALVSGNLNLTWNGDIWVDEINRGNEDPFVFNDPWLFSYCHASQLRRNENRTDNYVNSGSYLIFCSADRANHGIIQVDTVFVVGTLSRWQMNPLELPDEFRYLTSDRTNQLWRRHFRFPFLPNGLAQHTSVTHTYQSMNWHLNNQDYSFLPLNNSHNRVEFDISILTASTAASINNKIHGKYPVLLTQPELDEIMNIVNQRTAIKVIGNIT